MPDGCADQLRASYAADEHSGDEPPGRASTRCELSLNAKNWAAR